jgi:hypothetical protein
LGIVAVHPFAMQTWIRVLFLTLPGPLVGIIPFFFSAPGYQVESFTMTWTFKVLTIGSVGSLQLLLSAFSVHVWLLTMTYVDLSGEFHLQL